jgi:hypothetical protein
VTTHIVEMNHWVTTQDLKTLGQQIPPGVAFDTAVLFDVNPSATGLMLNLVQARQRSHWGFRVARICTNGQESWLSN